MLNLLLLPLLGGYFFLVTLNRSRAIVIRQSSYHLFFRSALAGLVLFLLARVMVIILVFLYPDSVTAWDSIEGRFVPAAYGSFAGTASLALLLGVCGSLLINYSSEPVEGREPDWGSEEFENYRVIEKRGDGIERTVAYAFRYEELLSVTMVTGKYYIGIVSQTPDPSQEYNTLELVPVSSGYRDPVTKAMVETDNYSDVLASLSTSGDGKEDGMDEEAAAEGDEVVEEEEEAVGRDYSVVLPLQQIVSMRLFYRDVFERFQAQGETEEGPADLERS